jgi:hypothetical protein
MRFSFEIVTSRLASTLAPPKVTKRIAIERSRHLPPVTRHPSRVLLIHYGLAAFPALRRVPRTNRSIIRFIRFTTGDVDDKYGQQQSDPETVHFKKRDVPE